MAALTSLFAPDLAVIAQAVGLAAPIRFGEVDAGTVNSNYWMISGGRRWFVRVAEEATDDAIAWETQVLTDLAVAGCEVVPPRPTQDGRPAVRLHDRWISVSPWRDGVHLAAGQVTIAHAHELGRQLGRLHGATTTVAPRASRYTLEALGRRLQTIEGHARRELTSVIATLRREQAWLSEATARLPAETTLIHADLFRDNVLWDPHAPRVVGLLDFEQACTWRASFDVAVALHDWAWRPGVAAGLDLELACALVDGYRATAPADSQARTRAGLAIDLRLAAWRFTITRLTDVYLRGVTIEGKDYQEFSVRIGPHAAVEGWLGESWR